MALPASVLESAGDAGDIFLCDGHAQAWTRQQVAERSDRLASLFRELGLGVVALHLDNGPDWLLADLACQQSATCAVPLPTFFSTRQHRHVLESVPVTAVITDRPELLAPALASRVRTGPRLPGIEATLLLLDPLVSPAVLPPDTGKVTFTSGSTGTPRGVCLSNAQLLVQAQALAERVGLSRPRHLCVLPLSTLLENVAGAYAPWLAGGEVVVPGLTEIGFTGSSTLDPQRFLALLARIQPDSLILTPQLLQLLSTAAGSGWTAPASLRFVAVGGARVAPGLVETARVRGIPAFEGYGLSECASVVSLNVPGDSDSGSCGRPLAHLHVDIEDGEVVVSGNAMLGYAGEPDSWGCGRIRTGDLGYLDSAGRLHVEGRRKNLLISSYGRNISPEWVESELQADGSLLECVVLGDARPWCVALVRPRDPEMPDAAVQKWLDHCNANLPDYARIQGWYRLAAPLASVDGLLTDNGRPRRHAIQAHFTPVMDALYETTDLKRIA